MHPHVLVGAAPVLSSEVTALIHKENVRCRVFLYNFLSVIVTKTLASAGVVNLCKEWNGQRAAYKAAGVSVIHLPTIDHYTPTLQQCDEGVKAMSKFVNRCRFCPPLVSPSACSLMSFSSGMRPCTCTVKLEKGAPSLSSFVSSSTR